MLPYGNNGHIWILYALLPYGNSDSLHVPIVPTLHVDKDNEVNTG